MNTTQSIIVYRNPAEAAMWDMIMNTQFGWWLIPILGGLFAAILVWIVSTWFVERFDKKWYWQNQWKIQRTIEFVTGITFLIVVYKLWI